MSTNILGMSYALISQIISTEGQMAQEKQPGVLDRMAGKTVLFRCNFLEGQVDYLHALVTAHQGKIVSELNATVDCLVLDEQCDDPAIRQQLAALQAKGAAIEVLRPAELAELLRPTDEDLCELIRSGNVGPNSTLFRKSYYESVAGITDNRTLVGKDLRGAKLKEVTFSKVSFSKCQFNKAELTHVRFEKKTHDCDFSEATLKYSGFGGSFLGNCFRDAKLIDTAFSNFNDKHSNPVVSSLLQPELQQSGQDFQRAEFQGGAFACLTLEAPDFSASWLKDTRFYRAKLVQPMFVDAKLENVTFKGCKLEDADFTNADLSGTNFAYAEFTGAKFQGANLEGVNLRGVDLNKIDLSQAINLSPEATKLVTAGPALLELERVQTGAQRIFIEFQVTTARSWDGTEKIEINTTDLKYGHGIRARFCDTEDLTKLKGTQVPTISDALLALGNIGYPITADLANVKVSSTKSPLNGKELWELVVRAIGEAFEQDVPANFKPARAPVPTKAAREAAKQERDSAELAADQEKAEKSKELAKKIETKVGQVKNIKTFLKALRLRSEVKKINKATKMLRTTSMKLFHDITPECVSGVVKSLTETEIVYACRLEHDGQYSCCTQNLNSCVGLRGSLCKHLLVLIIALVQEGELDPVTIDQWVAKSATAKSKLNKELMADILLKYRGAEAGKIDWRPMETLPEDYYAI